jgi:hypothetical protein
MAKVKVKTMRPAYPETIFLKIEDDGEDGTYFVAVEDAENLAVLGEETQIAEYVLQSRHMVKLVTEFESDEE